MQFEDLRLGEPLLRAVRAAGYATPTPIQSKAIPVVLDGRDVLGCAQTGTGKTAAFALPILQRLRKPTGLTRTLVLCPTRELAQQIHDSFATYGAYTGIRGAVIFGGVNQNRQVRALRAGVDVLVATPGRLLDLIGQGLVSLDAVEILVLDEADRMLDMGFLPDIRRILAQIPPKRQSLLFSATMPAPIRALADDMLHKPVRVEVARVSAPAERVEQRVYHVEQMQKTSLLVKLLRDTGDDRALVFTRTKHGADRVVRQLTKARIRAAAIHGNKNQNARTRALEAFRSAQTPVLVATDIAARGLDVDDIAVVINYDLTADPETYVHRIGRTGRAGAWGVAISFCTNEQHGDLRAIERLLDDQLEHVATPRLNGKPSGGKPGGGGPPRGKARPCTAATTAPKAAGRPSRTARSKPRHPIAKGGRPGGGRRAGNARRRVASANS